jgi:hypothetical protein
MAVGNEERVLTRNGKVFLVAFALVIAGLACFVSMWMSVLTPGITPAQELRFLDAKFSKGYLNLTVIYSDLHGIDQGVTIAQIKVNVPSQPFAYASSTDVPCRPFTVPKDEPCSITINYEWTPGIRYQILLWDVPGNVFGFDVVAP